MRSPADGGRTASPAGTRALFPDVPRRRGMYESFYLRAVAPDRPAGVWIRHTVHKPPRRVPRGAVWCTVWDGDAPPFMHKLATDAPAAPAGEWLAVGDSRIGPGGGEGACGQARWSLRFASAEPPLRHLPHELLYRAPLPRTKLTSPLPAARFEGTLRLSGRTIELDGWRGMVGHNWGAQHAERWVWLHGIDFAEQSDAWIDVAIGRVRVAGRATPWIANGAISLDGERLRLGGLGARGLLVAERPAHCVLTIPGADGLRVEAHVQAPAAALAGWRYADPKVGGDHGRPPDGAEWEERRLDGARWAERRLDGAEWEERRPDGEERRPDESRPKGLGPAGRRAEHDVSNCSIAALTLVVRRPGRPARTLRSAHGAAYELGMREHNHGVPLAPFGDG
ncbi:MAG TPA: hypothetical protein VNV37_12835 [Solirubrobacteraceae bacterium]|nr:hypothetical protein [Solirubrobacteraceae bacterium]